MPLHITPVALNLTPTSRTTVHPEDATTTLDGLHGAYRTVDLYARYRSACHEAGRKPATNNAFGRYLTSLGCKPWKTNTTRGWNITAS